MQRTTAIGMDVKEVGFDLVQKQELFFTGMEFLF
jgi:hypothetical protein